MASMLRECNGIALLVDGSHDDLVHSALSHATPALLERVLSTILTIATIVAAGVLVEGRLNRVSPGQVAQRVEYVEDWQMLLSDVQVPLDDGTRAIRVAVFTDFECPFCKRFDSVLAAIEVKHPGVIGRSIVHFPLPSHAMAMGAATALECAAAMGRAREMHDALYFGQRRLGTSDWSKFAANANVRDLQRFDDCIQRPSPSSRIEKGIALGRDLEISGTPAVLVNGWLVDPALPAVVEKTITDILERRTLKP